MKKLLQLLPRLKNSLLALIIIFWQVGFALAPFISARPVSATPSTSDHCTDHEGHPNKTESAAGNVTVNGVNIAWAGDPGQITFTNTNIGGATVTWCAKGGTGFSGSDKATGQQVTNLDPGEILITSAFGTEISYFIWYSVTTEESETGSLQVNKLVDREGEGEFVEGNDSEFMWNVDGGSFENEMGDTIDLEADDYEVNENISEIDGYQFVGWFEGIGDCSNIDDDKDTLPATVTVAANETTEITLCNAVEESEEGTGSITIIKDAQPDSEQEFKFTGSLGDPSLDGPNFTLVDDGDGTENERLFPDLEPGTYTVTEPNVQGWSLSDITCEGTGDDDEINVNNRNVVIELAAGDTVTCTFVNDQDQQATGSLQVNKLVDTDGDGEFEGGNDEANELGFRWSLDDGTFTNEMGDTVSDLSVGNHEVDENDGAVVGYSFVGWFEGEGSCEDPDETTLPVTAGVEANETTVITLCNAAEAEVTHALFISKFNNKPDPTVVGDIVTYTLVINVPLDSGTLYNVIVTDVTPENFEYIAGTATATQGSLTTNYASPGVWSLGTLLPGQTVTLTYQTQIESNVTPGEYPDIAFAYGYDNPSDGELVFASCIDNCVAGQSGDEFVGTDVEVLEGGRGQVLGATTVLARTGTPLASNFLMSGVLLAAVYLLRRVPIKEESK